MTQEPADPQEEITTPAGPLENPSVPKKKELTPEEIDKLEKEIRKQQLLSQLEEEFQDSPLGRLSRSKNFWYAIFGTIFVAIMLALIAWAAYDLGYWGR